MTIQESDIYIYNKKEYHLIASDKNYEFDIEELGLIPGMAETSLLRGYVCTYSLENGRLRIKDLKVAHRGEFPEINGVQAQEGYEIDADDEFWEEYEAECSITEEYSPDQIDEISVIEENDLVVLERLDEIDDLDEEKDPYENYPAPQMGSYKDINLEINHTGAIFIGRDYMTNKYGRWFKEPFGYSGVYEVLLEGGKITKVKYRNKEMRKVMTEINRDGKKKVLEEIGLDKCIKGVFDLDYDLKLYLNEGYGF